MSPAIEALRLESEVNLAGVSGATSTTDVNTNSNLNEHVVQGTAPLSPADPSPSKETDDLLLTDQTNLLPLSQIISVFAGLAVCIVVSTLDSTLVATALPSISATFRAGSVASFVPSAYLLTSTAFQPLYGRFSDIFGRKAALCLAMIVFIIGNFAAGFSKNIKELIVFRGTFSSHGYLDYSALVERLSERIL